MERTQNHKIDTSKCKFYLLSLCTMALWGSLFPVIKISYKAFEINTASYSDILLFAGIRFLVCGIIITAFSVIRGEQIEKPAGKSLLSVTWIGLIAVSLHYGFTYIGLSMTAGAKTAILKQSGALIYICVVSLFARSEKNRLLKLLGALLAFGGIIVLNLDGKQISFSIGDLLILLASACTIFSNMISKKALVHNPPILVTGLSEIIGGAMLTILAVAGGGKFPAFTSKSWPVFCYICIASILAYCIWYYVLKSGNLSQLLIIKFSETVFAGIFSAILLHENLLSVQTMAAYFLILIGIMVSEFKFKKLRNKKFR